jgi:oxygen-independent coproporphyrinogen-3 oxidase
MNEGVKCPYCDFFSHPCSAPNEDILLAGYIRDLKQMANLTNTRTLTSIFLGGGTPSLMSPSFIEKIMQAITNQFHLSEDVEITIEANPDAITLDKMRDFANLGINRLSIGVQALNDSDLLFLGRRHSVKTALTRIEEAKSVFARINMDLIYARPNQTLKQWENELQNALSLELEHYSLYQLTIEENTVFGQKNISTVDEKTAEQLYRLTDQIMTNADIPSYEVSNYAKVGEESQHNLIYWTGGNYLGIGPAAHGRIGLTASTSPKSVDKWIKEGISLEQLTPQERFEEYVLMGLRLTHTPFPTQGLSQNGIQKALKLGWITQSDNKKTITPTLDGTLMLNELILTVLS